MMLKSALGLIVLSKLLSKNQSYLKLGYLYQKHIKSSIHLSQVKTNLLNVCALPALSNTILDGA